MKRTKYPIHPDFKAWTNMNPPLNRAMLPVMQKLMSLLFDRERTANNLTVERKTIPAGDGASIRALWYCPNEIEEPSPCLVNYHGGGFVLPAAGKHSYSAPIDADSLAGLPAAYIETAEFDCLRDNGILYADRLRQFGVSAELNNTEGTMHGFDIVLDSPIVRACVDRRVAFLKRIFDRKTTNQN